MNFYNSLTRRQEAFQPLQPGKVGPFTCGPTVYNFAHIGNFRAYVFEDVLRRSLEFCGYQVVQVMNLTDVDDKTIRGAREQGVSLDAFTRPFKNAFFDDLKTLGIKSAEHYQAATDHIPEMIRLVERLFERGLAYRSDDGSVYFSVAKFDGYGKLAHLDREGMRMACASPATSTRRTRWAICGLEGLDEKDGGVAWDSPWAGASGLHIECSAMSMKYLGESFDIHTGGIDNLFPHHENEIAQAEGATGKPFVHTWLHCAHLRVNGEKMSKSLGNFFTLRDLLEKGYTGREIRYVLIAGHYRQPLNFTFDALSAARSALARIDEFTRLLEDKAAGAAVRGEAPEWVEEMLDAFRAAVADDLNWRALAAVHRLSCAKQEAAEGALAPPRAAQASRRWAEWTGAQRVLAPSAGPGCREVRRSAEERPQPARASDWAASIRLRNASPTSAGRQGTPKVRSFCSSSRPLNSLGVLHGAGLARPHGG